MVERIDNSGKMDEFQGKVSKIELEAGIDVTRKQFHIYIEPIGFNIKGPSGLMHEWVPMSPKATNEAIPQGSVLDRYLQQVEIVVPAAKKEATVEGAFKHLVGKKFRFQKMKLGKDFDGHKAKEYAVPVAVVN